MTRIPMLLLAAVLAACSSKEPAGITDVDTRQIELTSSEVTAQRVPEGVRITNGGSLEIRYLVKNAGWLGLLAGCHHEPSSCLVLGPGKSVTVKTADIIGEAAGMPVVEVWFWVNGQTDPAGRSIQLSS